MMKLDFFKYSLQHFLCRHNNYLKWKKFHLSLNLTDVSTIYKIVSNKKRDLNYQGQTDLPAYRTGRTDGREL
ncbi:hypothetical protein BpHYR1_009009 [Brachionus plicatilis]|uniref:Uncharacterized protein n=1 Tax=Brachionus plicatilis TaxID=10195 RepID=A0A3M7QED4_BRAPC|nr:hypothetical protein BpHYR1_009009 [Brachionus plicatilis]